MKRFLKVLSVPLILSLIFNFYFYSQLNDLQDLQNQLGVYQDQIKDLQEEKAALQNRLGEDRAPKIVTRLGVRDIRGSIALNHPSSNRIRLYIDGEVWNVGKEAAFNCRLHVILYQGATVANESWIQLGTIESASYVDIASNIYYNGSALTNWTIVPVFDNRWDS